MRQGGQRHGNLIAAQFIARSLIPWYGNTALAEMIERLQTMLFEALSGLSLQ